MKVYLDTNVLVSAFATRGLCADLVRTVLAEHDLVTGPRVLEELRSVLLKKLHVPVREVRETVGFLRKFSLVSHSERQVVTSLDDPGDIAILAEALSAEAEILVTGDRELLDLATVEGLPILSPREFWEKVKRE